MKTIKDQTKQVAVFIFVLGIGSIVASQLTGCGQGPQGLRGSQGPMGPVESVNSNDSVASIVNDYNAWRTNNGQENINPGLTCNLYTVPNTTTGITAASNGGVAPVLTNIGAFTYVGVFNQSNSSVSNGLNVLPTGLQGVYQNYFIIKCTGYLVVTTNDWHEFDTISDDGSNLYVDGALVVGNDGLHGAQQKSGVKHLQALVHTFELDFFQANGQQQLVADMDGVVIPSANFWH